MAVAHSFTPHKLFRHASHAQYTLATADSIQGNPAWEEGAAFPEPGGGYVPVPSGGYVPVPGPNPMPSMKQAVHRPPSLQNLHPGLAPTFPCGSEVQLCGKQVVSIPF